MKMNKKNLCIIIPTHKQYKDLNVYEQISLEQLRCVVGNKYDTYIVCQQDLKTDGYHNILPYLNEERFSPSFFKSERDYNRLCMDSLLYERFRGYEYMMIYQTDACIFYDTIDAFLKLGYNWYGAPIQNAHYLYNGGFNIRKIDECKKICDFIKDKVKFYLDYKINEDVVFSTLIGNIIPRNLSILFAWEHFNSYNQIKEYFQITENKGPMGCHFFKKERFSLYKVLMNPEILKKYENLI